jgi:homoserine O-acetyltransferase
VLIPKWFTGKSNDLAGRIDPGKLFDDKTYYLILVNAFGNGVSSSPSTSTAQPGGSFPDEEHTRFVAGNPEENYVDFAGLPCYFSSHDYTPLMPCVFQLHAAYPVTEIIAILLHFQTP